MTNEMEGWYWNGLMLVREEDRPGPGDHTCAVCGKPWKEKHTEEKRKECRRSLGQIKWKVEGTPYLPHGMAGS